MPEFKVCAVALARAPDQDVDLSLPPDPRPEET
jgi:hypothetical protein